ncbi:hypothetical protein KATP_29210 [Kluyvera ascorbata]|nr:hypothetical protein KATP_29210 [Kluyvera ascorbata]
MKTVDLFKGDTGLFFDALGSRLNALGVAIHFLQKQFMGLAMRQPETQDYGQKDGDDQHARDVSHWSLSGHQ